MTHSAAHTPSPVGDAAAIAAFDVHKSYQVGDREVEILHGVSLQVHPGQIVAVMGASGSGKSTLLYCLAGLEEVTGGQVMLAGRSLAGVSRADLAKMRRSEVGFVFQAYNLIPTLTATENVTLPYTLARRKPPAGLVEQTLAAACDRVLFMQDGLLVDELPGGSIGNVAARLARLDARSGE